MDDTILVASDLTKVIGKRTIVDSISFEVNRGEIFGFLGPNGAGKTTTIRMLVGLIKPSRGSVTINGYDIETRFEDAMRHVGCIVETPDLYEFMSGRENLDHFARMIGEIGPEEIERAAAVTLMSHRLEEKVKTYSLGMRQRLGIAVALLGRPDLLILDEPANGLDPVGIREMRSLLRRLASEENVGILVSSHQLSEVQLVADRVGIIHHGQLSRIGTVSELIASQSRMRLRVSDSESAAGIACKLGLDPVLDQEAVTVATSDEETPGLIRELAEAGVDVYEATLALPSLEDLFLEVTGGETVE